MSRYLTYAQIFDGKISPDFGVSKTTGSSLTIPGQGCDLAQIIASIVKLPPLDERTFDVPSGVEPDTRALAVKTELDGLYTPEGVALAQEAESRRQNARKQDKKENEDNAEERSDEKADE